MSNSDHTSSSTSGATTPPTSSTASLPCATCGKSGEASQASLKSKEPTLDDNASNIEFIENFLKCTICLDFPASPIHACDNAHVMCGQCAPKLSFCPTCKAPKLSPSPLGEKLAKEANKKIQCVNFEAGCKIDVLSTKFVDHLDLCYFREITCGYDLNCGDKVQFQEYTQHLKDVHKETIQIGPSFTKTYRHDEKLFPNSETTFDWLQWGESVITFRSYQFIIHAIVSRQRLFFSWVSVMGDKDLANKFICKVKFPNPKSNKLGCSWKLQVLALRDMPPSPSVAQLFEYSEQSEALAVPMGAIQKWGEQDNDEFLYFGVTYV